MHKRSLIAFLFSAVSILSFPAFADPVPETGDPDIDQSETEFKIPLEKSVQLAAAAMGDTNQAFGGGAVSGVFFIDNGRLGIFASPTVAIAGNDRYAYAYFELEAKLRVRVPIDTKKFVWVGGGIDVAGKVGGEIAKNHTPPSSQDPVGGYFKVQPVGVLGVLIPFANRDCVLGIYSKVGFGIYDSESIKQDVDSLAVWAKPMVGAEVISQCKSVRVLADYQHIFSFDGENVNRGFVDVSGGNWKVAYGEDKEKSIRIGLFGRGLVSHRTRPNPLPVFSSKEDPITHVNYTVLGGVQVLWE